MALITLVPLSDMRERRSQQKVYPPLAHFCQSCCVDKCNYIWKPPPPSVNVWRMTRLTRDGTAEPVSRDQILRRVRGLGDIHFPCSADHEQNWQPYPVDPYSAICDDHIVCNSKRCVRNGGILCVSNVF